jgi:hypothetical protein
MSTRTVKKLLEILNKTSDEDLKIALIEMHRHDEYLVGLDAQLVLNISDEIAKLNQTKPEYFHQLVRKSIVTVVAFRWAGLTIDSRYIYLH